MIATTHARRAFAPAPAPARRSSAPPLRLVDPDEARQRRRARLLTGALLTAALAGLFLIVALRVLLASGQGEVDRLERSIEQARATEQDLRLTVAQLEAPAQIVAAARQRLGMLTPLTVTSLLPPPTVQHAPPAATAR